MALLGTINLLEIESKVCYIAFPLVKKWIEVSLHMLETVNS